MAAQMQLESGSDRRDIAGMSVAGRKPRSAQRSAVSNGSRLLLNVDGRSPWVRRCKDVLAEHIADMGGVDNCSAAERSIIRRASVLTVELEKMEQRFAVAGEASAEAIQIYARVAANLRRLLEAVGLQRRATDVGPTLGDILRSDHHDQLRREDES
jgi:hypothetical protein